MPSTPARRKKKYINARVQGRFIGRIAAYWMLYHIVLWHGLFVYRYAQVRMSGVDGRPVGPIGSIYWQFCVDYSPLLVCSLLIMPLFMLDFLRMTHRFVGPLVRIRESLLRLMDNARVEQVEFRKGDLLPELQDTFNDFLSFCDHRRGTSARSATHSGVSDDRMTEKQSQALEAALAAESPKAEPAEVAV